MNDQRSSIGDRCGPVEAESVEALDLSIHQDDSPIGGEVGPPGSRVVQLRPRRLTVSKSQGRRVGPASTSKSLADQQSELRKLTRHVADGHEHALIVTGSGGLGKSYIVGDELAKCRVVPHLLTGRVTALSLYQNLYQHRSSAEVLLLDDVDSLDDRTVLAILKAATWESATKANTRIVEYNSTSPLMAKLNLPGSFPFEGRIIVLANETPRTRSWRAFVTRLLPYHIEADAAQVITFMQKITRNGFAVEMGTGPVTLSAADCRQVIDYLKQHNVTNLRPLRQALKLFHAHRAHDEWMGLVAATLAGAAQQVTTALTSDEHIVLALAQRTDLTRKQQAEKFAALPGEGRSRATYFRRLKKLGLT